MNRVSCIILAGGASRRMGEDKRRLRLWGNCGPTLLEHCVALASPLCAECLVVLNDPEGWPALGARLVRDEQPGAGPLAGLASGLEQARYERALLLACDLPLLQPALLQAMLGEPQEYDALVPVQETVGDRPQVEPLLAIYRRACLPEIRACLAHGERSMHGLLGLIQTRYYTPAEWKRYDPAGKSFLNLNQPQDTLRVTNYEL